MSIRWAILIICALDLARAQNGYPRENPSNPFGYNPFGQQIANEDEINGDEIPGEPGRDYPVYDRVPNTGFTCNNQQYPGYYADPEAQCQAFYVCQRSGRGVSFLCPNGTIFNQESLVCDWWYNFDCDRAEQLYSVNEMIAQAAKEAEEKLAQLQGGYSYNAPGQNGGYQNGGYQNGGYQNGGYQNGGSQNGGYQNGGYQNGGYQNGGYKNGGSQNGGYQNGGRRPSASYGVPSFGKTNGNGNGNGNGYNAQSISPVYGVPGQSGSFGSNGNGNGNGYSNGNGNGYTNGFSQRPSQNYGLPGGSNGGNGNGGNGNGYNGSPKPVYGPPSAGFSSTGVQFGSNGNGFSSSDGGNGNGQVYRNGFGNGPSNPDRSYLPPTGFNGNAPSAQYGLPGQSNRYSGRGTNGFNGNGSNGYNRASPDRSYLPPSK